MRTIETNPFKNASQETEQCRTHIVSRSYWACWEGFMEMKGLFLLEMEKVPFTL